MSQLESGFRSCNRKRGRGLRIWTHHGPSSKISAGFANGETAVLNGCHLPCSLLATNPPIYGSQVMTLICWRVQMRSSGYQWIAETLTASIVSWRPRCHVARSLTKSKFVVYIITLSGRQLPFVVCDKHIWQGSWFLRDLCMNFQQNRADALCHHGTITSAPSCFECHRRNFAIEDFKAVSEAVSHKSVVFWIETSPTLANSGKWKEGHLSGWGSWEIGRRTSVFNTWVMFFRLLRWG